MKRMTLVVAALMALTATQTFAQSGTQQRQSSAPSSVSAAGGDRAPVNGGS